MSILICPFQPTAIKFDYRHKLQPLCIRLFPHKLQRKKTKLVPRDCKNGHAFVRIRRWMLVLPVGSLKKLIIVSTPSNTGRRDCVFFIFSPLEHGHPYTV